LGPRIDLPTETVAKVGPFSVMERHSNRYSKNRILGRNSNSRMERITQADKQGN